MTDERDSTRTDSDRANSDRATPSRRRLLVGTATLAAGGLAGCSGLTGGDGGGGGGADPGPAVDSLTPAECEGETVAGDIETDTTWSAGECPRVALDGNVRVLEGATLTIEPGVEVVGLSGSRLTVKSGGSLVASGDPDNPVWFHGDSDVPGYWQGVWIRSELGSEIRNAVLQNGGESGYANVYLGGNAEAAITNVRAERSATAGLVADNGARLPEFATNEFLNNEGAAIAIPTTLAGAIDADSTYTAENGTDAVAVFSADVEEEATWPAAPYRFTGENHRLFAAVAVDPGAQLSFGEGARITVKAEGALTAEGTSEEGITFQGETDTPGYWEGIWIRSNNPNNRFDNVTVTHGGGNNYANIYLGDDARAAVTNSTLRRSATAGLVADNGARLPEFATNEFLNNEGAAIAIPTTLAGAIDADSTYTAENGTDAVAVFSADVEEEATWPAAPYRFTGENHRLFAAVAVDPGAQLSFGEGARITVKEGGSLTAEGTDDARVTFQGETDTPGYWEGIWIRSDNSNNRFDNTTIAHGGANGYANVYLGNDTRAGVTSSRLEHSATYGIYVGNGATLEASNNTFQDNADGDVREPES